MTVEDDLLLRHRPASPFEERRRFARNDADGPRIAASFRSAAPAAIEAAARNAKSPIIPDGAWRRSFQYIRETIVKLARRGGQPFRYIRGTAFQTSV
jgi:hypothetical protein